jgi:methyltransferase (TIGR00027 family)
MDRLPPGTYRPSQTAEVMALFRALETLRPARERLFSDPFAERFLRPIDRGLLLSARFRPIRSLIERVIDRRWPGARTSAIARTRLIDDALTRGLHEGVKQVVLLGAGFDSRAHRLADVSQARVFEVDQPATQKEKIRRITPRCEGSSKAVVYVPADFQTQMVDAALLGHGFDPIVRSFVVWEGVTNYLSRIAVESMLRALAGCVAPASHMIFTYVHRGLLDGTVEFEGGARILEWVRAAGEPWTCGFEPRELPAYLESSGWTLVEDLSADEYRARYFGSAARAMFGYSFYRAVIALTPSKR